MIKRGVMTFISHEELEEVCLPELLTEAEDQGLETHVWNDCGRDGLYLKLRTWGEDERFPIVPEAQYYPKISLQALRALLERYDA